MKKIIAILIVFGCCSMPSFSANIVDIYGAEASHAEIILAKYASQVSTIQSAIDKEEILGEINGKENTRKIEQLCAKKALLIENIKKEGDFLFVYISTTTYPGEKNKYTTIQVIEKKQRSRLSFVNPAENNNDSNKIQPKKDLIDEMIAYDKLAFHLIRTSKLNGMDMECPVYHCVVGFNHPKLAPYLNLFNVGVIKEKALILDTINQDANPERRAAAAFLIGHFSNPKEIISLLLPHVNDKNASVRNNVMRVIGATMDKAKISQIDVRPFLNLLNSPYGTDRNKASWVLFTASGTALSRSLIIQNGKDNLLAMLRLKQPNNHEPAYYILKKISGKAYGKYDIDAWDKWLTSAQNTSKKVIK